MFVCVCVAAQQMHCRFKVHNKFSVNTHDIVKHKLFIKIRHHLNSLFVFQHCHQYHTV